MRGNIFKNWIPVLVWCLLIFYLSSLQNLKTEFGGVIDLILRKGAHVTEYCILFLLNRRAFANSLDSSNKKKAGLFALIFSVLYAASDEYHQSFVPTRGPSVIDVGIDLAGATAGYMFFEIWKKLKERKDES